MPIYEYVCTQCGRRSEVIHGINTPGPTTCDVCGGILKKAISTPSIVFKGSGWAKRDARSSATKKLEAADAAGPSDSVADSAAAKGSDDGASAGATADSSATGSDSKQSTDGGSGTDTAKPKPASGAKSASKPRGSSGGEGGSRRSRSTGPRSTSGS